MIQHQEIKQKHSSVNQMRKGAPEGKKENVYGDRGRFGMLQSAGGSQALAYTMDVVQRQMDQEGLINGLIRNIKSSRMKQAEESVKSRCIRKLETLRQSVDPPAAILTQAEGIVNSHFSPLQCSEGGVYQVFFDYYGIGVKQGNRDTTKLMMRDHQAHDGYPKEWVTEEHIDEVFARDQFDLLSWMNSLYGTGTGGELLERLRDGGRRGRGTEIQMGFNLEGAYANATGEARWGELADPDGKKAGKGVGTSIFLNSGEQLPYLQAASGQQGMPEDPRIVLAHELIHALHAKMGVKPTEDTKIRKKIDSIMGSVNLERWLDQEVGEVPVYEATTIRELKQGEAAFTEARPDDIPVTGIMGDDVIYPEKLEAIKHINENQIRRELGLPLRTAY